MFRYERPQAGRFRQFVQFGIEASGSGDPGIDAEVLSLGDEPVQGTWFEKKLKLVINSLGDKESRTAHRNALIKHFEPTHRRVLSAIVKTASKKSFAYPGLQKGSRSRIDEHGSFHH